MQFVILSSQITPASVSWSLNKDARIWRLVVETIDEAQSEAFLRAIRVQEDVGVQLNTSGLERDAYRILHGHEIHILH